MFISQITRRFICHFRFGTHVAKVESETNGILLSRIFLKPSQLRAYCLPPTQSLPKKKEEYRKKIPVSYKTLLITAGISGALLAFMLYVRKEKEAGNFLDYYSSFPVY